MSVPIWLLNPQKKKRRRKKARTPSSHMVKLRRRAAGQLGARTRKARLKRETNQGGRMAKKRKSTRRPSAAQLRARRKFAAMARARSKAAKSTTRTRSKPVAAKRRRAKARKRTGTMRSVVRRGGGSTSRAAWRSSGFRRNPKRRVHRRRRRNPFGGGKGIVGTSVELIKQTVAVMAGQTLGRTVTQAIPLSSADPRINAVMTVGKGLAVAIAIKKFGGKMLSADLVNALAIGALQNPLRDAITAIVPATAPYLSGGFAFPSFPGAKMGTYAAYAADGSVDIGNTGGADIGGGLGAYSQEMPWNQ